jgi:hypothetical protein
VNHYILIKNFNFTTENNQFIMRIIKYVLLLLLLSLVVLHFIATQKVILMLKRSIINHQAVYSFVNDYKTGKILKLDCWRSWNKIKYHIPKKQRPPILDGKEGDGQMRTLFVKENDSISQKWITTEHWLLFPESRILHESQLSSRKNEFFFKIYAALNGGGVDSYRHICMNKV